MNFLNKNEQIDFTEFCKVYGKEPFAVPEEFSCMMKQVLPYGYSKEIPWNLILSEVHFKRLKEKEKEHKEQILKEVGQDKIYFDKIYSETKKVFTYLQPAKVNGIRYKIEKMSNEHSVFLDNFKVDSKGFLEVPKYSICDTVTGRQKITNGPNVLLLPKKLRNIFSSRFGNEGSIWYLDFTSLEPRVLLSTKQLLESNPPLLIGDLPLAFSLRNSGSINASNIKILPNDIYSDALKEMKLSSEITRDLLKQIILPQLYGQAKSATIETLEKQDIRRPDEVVEMVNEYFGIDFVKSKIFEAFEKADGRFVRTYYGRHVIPGDNKPHVLLNYFIQSTAVDVALLGFKQILERLKTIPKEKGEMIVPLFILHDALFLDINKSVEHLIPKLCKLGSTNIFGFEHQNFHLTGTKI